MFRKAFSFGGVLALALTTVLLTVEPAMASPHHGFYRGLHHGGFHHGAFHRGRHNYYRSHYGSYGYRPYYGHHRFYPRYGYHPRHYLWR